MNTVLWFKPTGNAIEVHWRKDSSQRKKLKSIAGMIGTKFKSALGIMLESRNTVMLYPTPSMETKTKNCTKQYRTLSRWLRCLDTFLYFSPHVISYRQCGMLFNMTIPPFTQPSDLRSMTVSILWIYSHQTWTHSGIYGTFWEQCLWQPLPSTKCELSFLWKSGVLFLQQSSTHF